MSEEQTQTPESLVTIRGLQDGFGTPLTRFRGKFHSYVPRPVNKFGKTPVDLNFQDITVIESSEPYPFPTATISINLSKSKTSVWGIFGGSLAKFLNEGEDIADVVGKVTELALTPGHNFGTPEGKTVTMACWEVIDVEGSGVEIKPEDRVLELLDGKTMSEFNQAVFADPIVKKDPKLISSILDNTYLPAIVAANKAVKEGEGDAAVYRIVKSE